MLPNFLIIGAAKSGTTSLYRHLAAHPQVFMSAIKETNFFALEGREPEFDERAPRDRVRSGHVHRLADYRRLFEGVHEERAVGEASPWYLHSEQAPSRILEHVPDARLIAILRNPVDRAYSTFRANQRDGLESCDTFEAALAEQLERGRTWNWGLEFLEGGFYHRHLSRYYRLFAGERIRIYLFEDLVADPESLMEDLYGFLDVDPSFRPSGLSRRYNASSEPRSMRARWTGLMSRARARAAPMSSAVRAELIEVYRTDVLELQGLIDRDLSGWLKAT